MLTTFAAGILSLLGVGCLFYSWNRDRRVRSSPIIWLGWLLLLFSLPLWFVEPGWEFGLVYGFSSPALFAWLFIYLSREDRRSSIAHEVEPALVGRPPWLKTVRHFGLFLVTVPLSGAASIPMTLLLVKLLPASDAMQMFWALIILPCLWGGMATWICGSKKTWPPALVILLSGFLSSFYLFL